ncbi:MAG: pyridoxal phosphate-dependent decarboxylase family protein [Ilumatobacteraceae bacterium]
MSASLHGAGAVPDEFGMRVAAHIAARIDAAPLGTTEAPRNLATALAATITGGGLGIDAAWDAYLRHVEPNCLGLDSERFLAFIPVSPAAAGVWMDAMVGAATFSAESWLEAAGAVAAEQATLRWLADLIGMPAGAGGCFMTGGSISNLSALAVAREAAGDRRAVAVGDTAHASIDVALRLLDLRDVVVVETSSSGRLESAALRAAIGHRDDVGVIVAAAGSTNAGVIDELDGIADVAGERGAWLHVDGAYGAAAMAVPEMRTAFAGIERADSVIIDPHKWLFAPEGAGAVLYRRPELAAAVHTQHGPYVDVLHADSAAWNPSDYGFQLTRRATGLPLWFILAVHGTEALADAIRAGIDLAAAAAERLAATPGVRVLMPPSLGVVLFERDGWGAAEWRQWASGLLSDGVAFVAPTTWKGRPVGRLVFMHPRTPPSIIDDIAASLGGGPAIGKTVRP